MSFDEKSDQVASLYCWFILQKAENYSHAIDIQTVLINFSFSQQKSMTFRDFTWPISKNRDFPWLVDTLILKVHSDPNVGSVETGVGAKNSVFGRYLDRYTG